MDILHHTILGRVGGYKRSNKKHHNQPRAHSHMHRHTLMHVHFHVQEIKEHCVSLTKLSPKGDFLCLYRQCLTQYTHVHTPCVSKCYHAHSLGSGRLLLCIAHATHTMIWISINSTREETTELKLTSLYLSCDQHYRSVQ